MVLLIEPQSEYSRSWLHGRLYLSRSMFGPQVRGGYHLTRVQEKR
jgi:hypothetical protein